MNLRIGVIDSGKGGEYISNLIKEAFPKASIIRYMKEEFVSYAGISLESLFIEADEHINFLAHNNVDAIVIGCMTLSVNALEYIKSKVYCPVFDLYTCLNFVSSNTTIIATYNTIESGRFDFCNTIDGQNLSGLIEEYLPWINKNHECESEQEYFTRIIEECYTAHRRPVSNTLLIGCSHYFWVEKYLIDVFNPSVIIHPGKELVKELKLLL